MPCHMQKKELFRLQAFLTALFFKSDSEMINDIFVMYDTDGSGELCVVWDIKCALLCDWHITL